MAERGFMFTQEIEFSLPHGVVDEFGRIHQQGRMRMATVLDEIEPTLQQVNEAYLPILLLARVITQLGELVVSPQLIESLYAADMAYLEDLYLRLNSHESVVVGTACPHCSNSLQVQVAPLATMLSGGVAA